MTISAVGAQAGGTTTDSASATTRAFPSNVTAGNMIVVVACKDAAGSAFVAGDCTKSAGTATIGTISLDKELRIDLGGASGDEVAVGIWSCLVTGSGSCTMRVGGASGTYWVLGTMEFSSDVGFDASRLEASSSGSSTTDNVLAASSGNGTSAGKAVFVGVMVSNGSATVTITPDAAFTQVYEEQNGSLHLMGSVIRQIVAAGTTDAAEWTLTESGQRGYAAALAVYKEVGAAGDTLMAQGIC